MMNTFFAFFLLVCFDMKAGLDDVILQPEISMTKVNASQGMGNAALPLLQRSAGTWGFNA